jgi:hypothetical protein
MGALLASLVHAEIDTELVAKSIDFMKRQTSGWETSAIPACSRPAHPEGSP